LDRKELESKKIIQKDESHSEQDTIVILLAQDIWLDIGVVELGKIMNHIIYKITNNINGKYYIGRHSTENIDDGYMGSGVGIINAIKKYGKENFTKEILEKTNTTDELWETELKYVNEDVVKDSNSYNISLGGKHYLYGLRRTNKKEYTKHQSNAGKVGGVVFYNSLENKKEWHQKGGSVSSRKRASLYIYEIIEPNGNVHIVNGLEFKQLCNDKGWNYNTLHWKNSMNKYISRGKHKGFKVTQLQTA
jgi:hypothetical protein